MHLWLSWSFCRPGGLNLRDPPECSLTLLKEKSLSPDIQGTGQSARDDPERGTDGTSLSHVTDHVTGEASLSTGMADRLCPSFPNKASWLEMRDRQFLGR